MPNALVLEKKQQQVAELKEKIAASVTGVIVDYKGITVADDTALRKELRENGVEYFTDEITSKSILHATIVNINTLIIYLLSFLEKCSFLFLVILIINFVIMK